MNKYRDKRAQVAPVTARSFWFLVVSAVAIVASIGLLERTMEARRLAWNAGLIGAVVVGLPLCWIVRHRRLYDHKLGYIFQMVLTWLLLLAAGAFNGVNAGALMNAYCGKQTEYSITTENFGLTWHRGRHECWYMVFEVPGYLNQRLELKEGEKAKYEKQKYIELHMRSGSFNFPLIESYGIPSTNSVPAIKTLARRLVVSYAVGEQKHLQRV